MVHVKTLYIRRNFIKNFNTSSKLNLSMSEESSIRCIRRLGTTQGKGYVTKQSIQLVSIFRWDFWAFILRSFIFCWIQCKNHFWDCSYGSMVVNIWNCEIRYIHVVWMKFIHRKSENHTICISLYRYWLYKICHLK